MKRVRFLDRSDIRSSSVYLFEGGMARQHRTIDSKDLTYKIRLSSLFTSHIFVHPGNLFEEPAMFEAVKMDANLLNQGRILPVLRGSPKLLEDYGDSWRQKYYAGDPGEKAYYQSRPLAESDLAEIEKRVDFFRDTTYRAVVAKPVDRQLFKAAFLASVSEILDDEPSLDTRLKDSILETAAAASSPLGKIRQEVLKEHWNKKGTAGAVQRIARRINLAFFGCGAAELDTWFSLQPRAFRDLQAMPRNRGQSPSELVELSAARALDIKDLQEKLIQIDPDDFASIVESTEASKFRADVSRTLTELSKQFIGEPDLHDKAAIREVLQRAVDENFCDTFASSFDRVIKKMRRAEARRSTRLLQGSLMGLGAASDFVSGHFNAPFPVGFTAGTVLAKAVEKVARPRVTPIILLQTRLNNAALSKSLDVRR
jgi:hypothetical protein